MNATAVIRKLERFEARFHAQRRNVLPWYDTINCSHSFYPRNSLTDVEYDAFKAKILFDELDEDVEEAMYRADMAQWRLRNAKKWNFWMDMVVVLLLVLFALIATYFSFTHCFAATTTAVVALHLSKSIIASSMTLLLLHPLYYRFRAAFRYMTR